MSSVALVLSHSVGAFLYSRSF